MRGNLFWRAVLVLSVAAILSLAASTANAGVVTAPVNAVTGSHGGDGYANGMISLINGSGMTRPDLLDPSTWSRSGDDYPSEWMASSLVDALNSKVAWASFDLGTSTSLADLYLWNNTYQGGISGTKSYNLYYADSPTVPLPAQPNNGAYSVTGLTPQGDYDFVAGGGWTLFNTSGALSVPKAGTSIVDLSGITARYIAVEILLNWGDTYDVNRVGFSEVAVTRNVTDMTWLGGVDNWSNAAKWDPGLFTDVDVTIDVAGSVVTVDAAASAYKAYVGENNASSLVIGSGNTLAVTDNLGTGLTIGASGSMTVDGTLNATVLNSSGTVTINSTANMAGVGTVNVNAGSVTATGSLALGNVNLNSGSITGAGAITLGNVNLNGGTLAAGGLLTVDSLNLAGGLVDLGVGANNLKVNNTLTVAVGSLDMTAANMGSLNVSTAAVAVQGGTLKVDEALTAASLTYDSGTLDLGGKDLTVGSLTTKANLDVSGGTLSASTAITVKNATLTVGHAIATETLTLDGATIVGGAATASVKYSLTNVGVYSADITGASAELVIGEDYSQDHQVTLTGNNTYGGGTTIYRGVLEVAPDAANLSTGRLTFKATYDTPYGDLRGKPTVLQTSGIFERQLGAANGLYFQGSGGFAARGGDLKVTLLRADGNTSAPLFVDWQYNENGISGPIQFGSPTADSTVELTNDVLCNNYHLDLRLNDNPNSSTDISLLSGDISDPSSSLVLYRSGAGTLWLTGNNTGFQKYSLGGGNQGVIRAVDGIGLSPTALLQFDQGVLESSGTFTREIGSTNGNGVDPGKVYWNNEGGFSAYGGPLEVALKPAGGLVGGQLTWGSSTTGFNGMYLYLGSPTANNVVTLTNPIDGGNGTRYIYVSGNPDSDADYAVMSGDLTSIATLYVCGTSSPGELRVGNVTATDVYVETGAKLGGAGTIIGKLTVQANSTVAPGAGVGTLTVTNNTTLANTSIYEWQVGQPGSTDILNITAGTLTLANFTLKILDADGYVASDTDQLPVFTYSGGVTVNMTGFANNFDISALDETWTESTLALTDGGAGIIYLTGLAGGTPEVPPTIPGDTNDDGVVDAADYIAIKTNFGMTEGATRLQGDLDGDFDVDWTDLQELMCLFGTRSIGGAPAIPEPATLGLLAIGALAVLRRRRRTA